MAAYNTKLYNTQLLELLSSFFFFYCRLNGSTLVCLAFQPIVTFQNFCLQVSLKMHRTGHSWDMKIKPHLLE